MKTPPPSVLAALTLSLLVGGCATEPLARAPGPRPTADQVLDGKIPGRPDPAGVTPPILSDAEGFAQDRLYHVPPVGIHPRILFSPQDIPRIRKQLTASATGRDLMQSLEKQADADSLDKTGWLGEVYRALASGDETRFAALQLDPRNSHKDGPPGSTTNAVTQLLFYRSFLSLLNQDHAQGVELATAVTTYVQWLRPRVEAAAKLPGAENFWLELRPVVGDSAQLAYLYDFTQPSMTPSQADVVRGLLAFITHERYGLGMDLPPHWRTWNFIGMGLYYPQYALAIEGEPGFDPRIVARGAEVARDYILHACTANGLGKEGMGYHTAGMSHTTVLMLALANRGTNLFTLARYRAMFDHWMLWTMQPTGRFWATNGDLGTFPPSPPLVQAARWLFPDDDRIALVARQSAPATKLTSHPPEIALLQLLCPSELGADSVHKTAPAFPAGLPLSLYDKDRGVLFTRTGWKPDDLTLQFNARSDTTFPSHDHADRGDFFINALGQAWSVPAMRETGSEHHSVITVDDVGQGFFATPATWLSVNDSPAGTTATVDLSYCYDWRWMKSSFLATDEQLKNEPWLEWVREPRDRLLAREPRDHWQRDPSPTVRAYYQGWLSGDPRMWGEEDSWVLRAPNLPVKKAFRSIALVRGDHPFVVVSDDMRVDDSEHLYQWRMILSNDVEAYKLDRADIMLGPVASRHETKLRSDSPYKDVGNPVAAPGTPRLLVRILRLDTPRYPERTPSPCVESVEFIKHDDVHQFAGRSLGDGKRLVLPSRSVEPGYRVLLFPYREGEPLPKTTMEGDVLTVTAGDQTSRVKFTTAADGSPRLEILP